MLFSKSRYLLEVESIFFTNLKSLKVSTDVLNSDLIHAVFHILMGSPVLETLVIEYQVACCKEAYILFELPLSHLKEVEISNFQGSYNELNFAKWILQNAVALESMIITSSGTWTSSRPQED